MAKVEPVRPSCGSMATTCWLSSVPTFSSVTGPVLSPSHLSSLECLSSSSRRGHRRRVRWYGIREPCRISSDVPVVLDDFARRIVRFIFRNHQLKAEALGQEPKFEGSLFFVLCRAVLLGKEAIRPSRHQHRCRRVDRPPSFECPDACPDRCLIFEVCAAQPGIAIATPNSRLRRTAQNIELNDAGET